MKSYIPFAKRNRFLLAGVMLLLAIASLFFISSKWRLNTDLAALLPENLATIKALEESKERFGASDKFMLVIQSDDGKVVAAIQDSIESILLRDWRDRDSVLIRTQKQESKEFFRKNALLYLPTPDLERIYDNLKKVDKQIKRKYTDADDMDMDMGIASDEPEEDLSKLVWLDTNVAKRLGLPDEAAGAFTGFLPSGSKDSNGNAAEDTAWDAKAGLPEHLKERLIGLDKRNMKYNGVVICKLTGAATDIEFTKMILAKKDILFEQINKMTFDAPYLLGVAGSYEGLKDVKALANDGLVSGVISVSLIILIMLFFFRGVRGVILVLLQVGLAALLMLDFALGYFGELNYYTIFVAAIILGMGIDYSIHFVGTAQRRMSENKKDLVEALQYAMGHLKRPMLLAAITTIAGMLTLVFADFRGFVQFGGITALGILFSVLTAYFGLPVLILLMGLPEKKKSSMLPKSWDNDKIIRIVQRTGLVVLVLTVALALFIPKAEFENNMRKLRPPKPKVKEKGPGLSSKVAQSGGKRRSSQPVVVLSSVSDSLRLKVTNEVKKAGGSDSLIQVKLDSIQFEQLNSLHEDLLHRLHGDPEKGVPPDSMIMAFLTERTFVPHADSQKQRMKMIKKIKRIIKKRYFMKLEDEKQKEMVQNLREMVQIKKPIVFDDLPHWAQSLLLEKDNSHGKVGFIYGKFRSWDALDVRKFQQLYGNWEYGGEELRSFSSAFIYSDVVASVKEDSVKMGIGMAIVLFLTLLLSLQKWKLLALSIASLGAGVLWTVGFMGLFTTFMDAGRLTVFNVIVIPLALGVGIDGTIHMLVQFERSGLANLRRLYDNTGRMVIASSLTTIGGFVGILFVSHRGMRTIGELAVIAVMCTLLTALVVVPALGSVLLPKKEDN